MKIVVGEIMRNTLPCSLYNFIRVLDLLLYAKFASEDLCVYVCEQCKIRKLSSEP